MPYKAQITRSIITRVILIAPPASFSYFAQSLPTRFMPFSATSCCNFVLLAVARLAALRRRLELGW